MASLASLTFSDLLLLSEGQAFLKGTPEYDQQLVAVPSGFEEEQKGLLAAVETAFAKVDPMDSIRVSYGGVSYRVAGNSGVMGKTWFLRRLPYRVPDFNTLGLPEQLTEWLLNPIRQKGLLLFSGPQSSGKTTSAAAFVAAKLARQGGHAITFENPVEMPLEGQHGAHGYCFQTQIQNEAELSKHIERSHRYASPNIIYVGEIRTKHAAGEALRVSLGSSRQMVVATIHGLDVTTALDRLMTYARDLDGEIACQNVAHALLGVIHQELTADENGKGKRVLRVPQFLLAPFTEKSKGIRAKLREGNLVGLEGDIREQQGRMKFVGLKEFDD